MQISFFYFRLLFRPLRRIALHYVITLRYYSADFSRTNYVALAASHYSLETSSSGLKSTGAEIKRREYNFKIRVSTYAAKLLIQM